MIYVKKEQYENGEYVDSNGVRYALDWGHMVVSPHGTPEELGYEQFESLEDALIKWELMKSPELTRIINKNK